MALSFKDLEPIKDESIFVIFTYLQSVGNS